MGQARTGDRAALCGENKPLSNLRCSVNAPYKIQPKTPVALSSKTLPVSRTHHPDFVGRKATLCCVVYLKKEESCAGRGAAFTWMLARVVAEVPEMPRMRGRSSDDSDRGVGVATKGKGELCWQAQCCKAFQEKAACPQTMQPQPSPSSPAAAPRQTRACSWPRRPQSPPCP